MPHVMSIKTALYISKKQNFGLLQSKYFGSQNSENATKF